MLNGWLKNTMDMETKFNFKSQVCTSIEQSCRLLELGLKKETADFYTPIKLNPDKGSLPCPPDFWTSDEPFIKKIREASIPAWSLHRLIEMMPEEIDRYFCTSFLTLSKHNVYYNESVDGAPDMEFEKNNLYDSIIDCIEWLIKEGYFNKEYLV